MLLVSSSLSFWHFYTQKKLFCSKNNFFLIFQKSPLPYLLCVCCLFQICGTTNLLFLFDKNKLFFEGVWEKKVEIIFRVLKTIHRPDWCWKTENFSLWNKIFLEIKLLSKMKPDGSYTKKDHTQLLKNFSLKCWTKSLTRNKLL